MVVRPFPAIESKSKYEELNELYNLSTQEELPDGDTISRYFQNRGIIVSPLVTRNYDDLAILIQTLRSISEQYTPTENYDDHFIQEPSAIQLYEDNWASIGDALNQTILRIENLSLERRSEEVEAITLSMEDDLETKTKKLGPLLEKLFLAGEDKVREVLPLLANQLQQEGKELKVLLSQKWKDLEPTAKNVIVGCTAALVMSMSANDNVGNHSEDDIISNAISMSQDTSETVTDPVAPLPTLDASEVIVSSPNIVVLDNQTAADAQIIPDSTTDEVFPSSSQITVTSSPDDNTHPVVAEETTPTKAPSPMKQIEPIPTITNQEIVGGNRLITTAPVQTLMLDDGSHLYFDHGVRFYKAQQGESLWKVWSKLKKYDNFGYLKQSRYIPSQKTVNGKTQARDKTFAWNVPDVFPEGLLIPIPLDIAERKLSDLELIKSIVTSLDLVKEHDAYGSFVNDIEKSLGRNHLVKVMISFAKKESHAGSNSLSRYEPHYDSYSFSLYHILTEKARDGSNGPGLRALNKLGFTQGEVMADPVKAGQRFWGYWSEKCTELSRSKHKSRSKRGKKPSTLFAEKNLSTLGTIYNGTGSYGKALAKIYENLSAAKNN